MLSSRLHVERVIPLSVPDSLAGFSPPCFELLSVLRIRYDCCTINVFNSSRDDFCTHTQRIATVSIAGTDADLAINSYLSHRMYEYAACLVQ